jgi:hypothetical protein
MVLTTKVTNDTKSGAPLCSQSLSRRSSFFAHHHSLFSASGGSACGGTIHVPRPPLPTILLVQQQDGNVDV